MPCYEINLATVEFKVKNIGLLERAIYALKWNYAINGSRVTTSMGITIDLNDQTVSYPSGQQDVVNRLKQEYSHEVIKQAAKKKRWILSNKGTNKYIARRY